MKNAGHVKFYGIFYVKILLCLVLCLFLTVGCANFGENSGVGDDLQNTEIPNETAKPHVITDLKNVRKGDIILFGRFEQDNNTENGPENIEWLVLEREEDTLFVITRYAITWIKYHIHPDGATWINTYCRSWLNGEFYEEAFTEDEKSLIILETITTPENPMIKYRGPSQTEDRIYTLSIQETLKYFPSEDERICYRSQDSGQAVSWWLRSTGGSGRNAAFVSETGEIVYSGSNVYDGSHYLRPAMKINAG